MAGLLPNAIYHNKSVVQSYTYGDKVTISSTYVSIRPLSDTGVFIRLHGRSETRTTALDENRNVIGGSNMIPVDSAKPGTINSADICWPFAISCTNSAMNDAAIYTHSKPIAAGSALYSNANLIRVGAIPVSTILSTGTEGSKLSLTVDKMEICYANTTKTKESVYITGISMLCTMDGKIMGDVSFITARAIPISGTGFIDVEQTGGSTVGSVMFRTDGSTLACMAGDNITSLSSRTISQAIPESAMVSNDGLAAVSCMASGDGEARWLGYKNGIYKIYQGPKPLIGMPGETVTIKEHKFVCLAYGSYYARTS